MLGRWGVGRRTSLTVDVGTRTTGVTFGPASFVQGWGMPGRGWKGMVANAIGHSFDRAGGVSSREPGAGLVCLRTARLDADSFGHRFPSRTGHRCGPLHWPHTGDRTGRSVNRGRLPDRFHRPERTIPHPACHPELDSGSPRRAQCKTPTGAKRTPVRKGATRIPVRLRGREIIPWRGVERKWRQMMETHSVPSSCPSPSGEGTRARPFRQRRASPQQAKHAAYPRVSPLERGDQRPTGGRSSCGEG